MPNNGQDPLKPQVPTLNISFGPGDQFLIIKAPAGSPNLQIVGGEFQRDVDNLAMLTGALSSIVSKMYAENPDQRRIVPANPGMKKVE